VAAEYPEFRVNPYMFTGRRFDYETGLYYYRARYYNPYIGRFLQTDPVGYGAGINWYAYCRNNPLTYVDPSGLMTTIEVSLISLMMQLFDIFDNNDLYFIYDGCDIWVTSDYDDLYDFGPDPLIASKDSGDLDLANVDDVYLPGVSGKDKRNFLKWLDKYKNRHGYPPDHHFPPEEQKELYDEWEGLGKPAGANKPIGKKPRRRLRELGDNVFKTAVTAWINLLADTLEQLPSDDALYTGSKVSLGVSGVASLGAGGILLGPTILPWLAGAGAGGALQPALQH
jgi:RHS repeat-associated protein